MEDKHNPSECKTDQELTTISIRKATKERLKPHGQKGQTWDSVVLGLVDSVENQIEPVIQDMKLPVFLKTSTEASEIQVGHIQCSIIEGCPPRIIGDLDLFPAYKEAIEKDLATRCGVLEELGKL